MKKFILILGVVLLQSCDFLQGGCGGFDRSESMDYYMHEKGYSYDEANEATNEAEDLMWEPH